MFITVNYSVNSTSDKHSDTPVMLMDEWTLMGAILHVILILTPFNIEKCMANKSINQSLISHNNMT